MIRGEEAIVREEMRLQPRQRQRIVRELTDQIRVGNQRRAAAFVLAPGPREGQMHARIGIEQAPHVSAQHIAALALGQHLDELAPGFRIDMARTAEKPFDFTRAAEEHAAQDETEAALWHRLPVGQRQRAAPGAAEQKPLPDSQVFAQALQILNQMLGRVARDFTDRRRGAGTALVVQHDPEKIRVEEAAVFGRAAAARTAVQEHDRNAPGVSADLPVHRVDVVERQHAAVIGLDRSV